MAKKHGPATQMGLRQAEINKKNLQGKAPEVAPMIDLGGDQIDIGFNANTIEDPMLMRHLKGVPKQPSIEDIIEEIEDNFQYIELLANATPYGMMVPYALTIEPVDWVFCNGQVCPESPLRDQLIAAGNPFGTVGGAPAVPNLSGRTVVGNTAMGNVQQPALPNATTLNTKLGTTNGLFKILANEAPQRPHNIGTTDNNGLLTITTDKIATGVTVDLGYSNLNITDNDQANLSINNGKANLSINNGKADLVNNSSSTPVAGELKNTTTANGSHDHKVNNVTAANAYVTHSGNTGHLPINANGNSGKPSKLVRSIPQYTNGTHDGWDSSSNTYFNVFQMHPGTDLGENSISVMVNQGRLSQSNMAYLQAGQNPYAFNTTAQSAHTHNVYDRNHSHSITQNDHNHGITQNDHSHGITDVEHDHTITDPTHNHVVHATGTIPGSDFEFDLTQPGLVVNFIIFHGQHLPEDTEPVVRHNELAPIVAELEAATKANADLIEQNTAMMKKLEAQINV